MNLSALRFVAAAVALAGACAANAVDFSDVSVTTTTGTYTMAMAQNSITGEGFFFVPNIDLPIGSGIEIESVDDLIGPGEATQVLFSYTVTANPGELIYAAEVTPGLYLYDATGNISIDFGGYTSYLAYSDDGSGFGTSSPNYSVDFGAGVSSLTVTGEYDLSTLNTQDPWAVGYADHLITTFSENATPGPAGLLTFSAGLFAAAVRRRAK